MRVQLVVSHSPHFSEQALNEFGRFCSYRSVSMAPGVTGLQLLGKVAPLQRHWRCRPPIYLHHLFYVQQSFADQGKVMDWLASRLARPFRFHYRNLDILPLSDPAQAEMEAELIARSGQPTLTAADQIVSVCRWQERFLLGISRAKDNLSPWPAGRPPFEPDHRWLNRAEPKLVTDDPMDLSSLPTHDVDDATAERMRRRAQATLARQRDLADRPALAAFSRFYSARLEPALVITASVLYLSWAVSRTLQVFH